jgi:hypothetical protein
LALYGFYFRSDVMNMLFRLLCCVALCFCGVAFAAEHAGPEFVVDVGYVAKVGGGCPRYARVIGPDKYCWPAVAMKWIDGRIAETKVSFNGVCFHEKIAEMYIAPTVFVCGMRDRVCRRCT